MICIDKQQYSIDMLNYADQYQQRLKNGMYKNSSYIDSNYVREVINELQSFTPLIRMECLNDMTMLHNDIAYARNMKDGYENFADYCYDILSQAFRATNDALVENNQLCYELQSKLGLEHVDVSISSNYIAFNLFGKGGLLELTGFRRMTGLGLCYDITLKQPAIRTSNVQEQMTPVLDSYVELADVIRTLKDNGPIAELLDKWSSAVNDKFIQAKADARAAWHATYNAYKKDWFNVEFAKQNGQTYCTLSLTTKKISEMVCKHGHVRRIDYGMDYMKVLELDYINSSNVEFK